MFITGVTVILFVIPFLLDATTPQRITPASDPNEMLLTDLETAHYWPLKFDAVAECVGSPAVLSEGIVDLDCGSTQLSVYGMDGVENNKAAIELGIKRSLRLLTMDKTVDEDVVVNDLTAHVEQQVPGRLHTMGADSVWLTEPFTSGTFLTDPRFGTHSAGTELGVGFYRSFGHSGTSLGELVVVNVVASHEKDALAMAAALVDTATEVGESDA